MMRMLSAFLVLFPIQIFASAAKTLVPLEPAVGASSGETDILIPQENRNGWVNPEDLIPMPQCIAQQDCTAWLNAMTRCTSKRCTRHFGVICTHQQWLTQLSCLNNEFSSDMIRQYLPYCSRSVLAKAQLYQWIHTVTGRTWLVNVGDANELQNLSPALLTRGYATLDVISTAPTCLVSSASALSKEPFQHAITSCLFTSTTQHTGNAVRPWEYDEKLGSIITLDSETVGYDLVGHNISDGDYFDKACFCDVFTLDTNKEPCSDSVGIDLTGERLWINATCGPTELPKDWKDTLKTTESAYFPVEDWRWPRCVTNLPEQQNHFLSQCETEACEIDSSGYCRIRQAIEKACFCSNINYNSIAGPCHVFEARIDYVNWLHGLCSDVEGWHGLPEDWHHLATPTLHDMIPWSWTVKANDSSIAKPIDSPESSKGKRTCPSTGWKVFSIALANATTLLAVFSGRIFNADQITSSLLSKSLFPQHQWVINGILIASLHFIANWLNAYLVQTTLGYQDVPIAQLTLLWCSLPRLTWLLTARFGVQSFEARNFSMAASTLLAETILQALSSSYMIMVLNYGVEHKFYSDSMKRLEDSASARLMYTAAQWWLHFTIISLLIQSLLLYSCRKWSEEDTTYHQPDMRGYLSEDTSSIRREGSPPPAYGTFSSDSSERKHGRGPYPQKEVRMLYVATGVSVVLWVAQWLFWIGFLNLSLEEFCPPKFAMLTAIWIIPSFAGAIVAYQ